MNTKNVDTMQLVKQNSLEFRKFLRKAQKENLKHTNHPRSSTVLMNR